MNWAELWLSLLASWATHLETDSGPSERVSLLLHKNYIEIAGHKIFWQNESSEKSDMERGIYVGRNGVTYFSTSAASAFAQQKNAYIPSAEDWQKMSDAVGGWFNLCNILGIELDGFYSMNRAFNTPGEDSDSWIIHAGAGGKIVVLHTGTVDIPYSIDARTWARTDHPENPMYSYLYIAQKPYLAGKNWEKRTIIDSGVYRDRYPHRYLSVLRLAHR